MILWKFDAVGRPKRAAYHFSLRCSICSNFIRWLPRKTRQLPCLPGTAASAYEACLGRTARNRCVLSVVEPRSSRSENRSVRDMPCQICSFVVLLDLDLDFTSAAAAAAVVPLQPNAVVLVASFTDDHGSLTVTYR